MKHIVAMVEAHRKYVEELEAQRDNVRRWGAKTKARLSEERKQKREAKQRSNK